MGWTVYWHADLKAPFPESKSPAIAKHVAAWNKRLSKGCEKYRVEPADCFAGGIVKIHNSAAPERDLAALVAALAELSALLEAKVRVSDDYILQDADPNNIDLKTLGQKTTPRMRDDVPLPPHEEDIRAYVALLAKAARAGNELYRQCYDTEVFHHVDFDQHALNAVERSFNALERFRKQHRIAEPEPSKKPKRK